ncbi:hypothetical protein [Chthonomonas calidirosea]|nr:hypothetical protein [Chthonomonas calidirosea]
MGEVSNDGKIGRDSATFRTAYTRAGPQYPLLSAARRYGNPSVRIASPLYPRLTLRWRAVRTSAFHAQ